ncbi:uncharacterized protein LOC119593794 [Penaeus monodon]|uniref:uncharacterized protein LOC119593794 n=1 Tax=Penaeus monodon TaxID=6687 RepID=UPI0018A7BDE4|nr:uncharacterized protein LOC119593794 [Penaeus monodon]
MALAKVTHPLDFRMYSWLVANTSWAPNATVYPAPPQSYPIPDLWTRAADVEHALLDIAFQDLPLGVITLLALQKGVRCSSTLYHPVTKLAVRYNIRFYDIIITNILKTFVGMFLMAVSLPLVLPVVCAFWLASCVVSAIYRTRYRGVFTKARGMDSVWGVESKESRPFITICLLVSGAPRLEDIQRHLREKILDVVEGGAKKDFKYKKFRQVFSRVCGYYCWRDAEDFDIGNHVRMLRLSELYPEGERGEGEAVTVRRGGEEEKEEGRGERSEAMDSLVHRFLSEEGTTALSPDRPPWEVLLLLREDGRYNVVIRLHHAIGDGVTLIRLCVEALVDTPLPAPPVGTRSGNALMKAVMAVWSCLVLPLGLLQVVANFDRNCLHGRQLSGKKVVTSSRGLALATLRQVKTAAAATVNDVLMACLSLAPPICPGALISGGKSEKRRLEEVSQVTAVVPVSFHDLRAPLTLTNKFSVATVKLPSSHCLAPDSRLRHTKTVLDGMKRDPTLAAVFWVVRAVSEVLPAPVAELLLSGRGVSVAASNVPGPQKEISVWGDKIEDLLFWVPNRAPVGVGVSFASYMGVVKIGLNVDAALVRSRREAQMLLEDMEEELLVLHRRLVLGQP